MPKKPKVTAPHLGTPMPTNVQEDEEFRPLTLSLNGRVLDVVAIDKRVKGEEWWEIEPMFKMHYQVTLEDEQQVTIFRNMKAGGWYRIAKF